MNIRFRNLTLILLVTILFNCSEESKDIDIKEKRYKTIITLSKERKIKRVDFYESDTLRYSQFTYYTSGLVEILQTDNNENLKTKSSYFLDSTGLAYTCIDSSYYNFKLSSINVTNFKYNENGYKIDSKITTTDLYNSSKPSISKIELIYEIVDGNMISMNIGGHCSDYYEYTNLDNKLDIISFLGDFCGKSDSKLRKSYNSGCHYTPSTAPPSSTYDYKLNSDGFVVQKVEDYTSSYHIPDSKPIEEKRITNFEYKNE
jgi:hypothetical protein